MRWIPCALSSRHYALAALLGAALAGCGSGTITPGAAAPIAAGTGALAGQTPSNSSGLSISGSPPSVILPGRSFAFRPSASDRYGNTLRFSITGQPVWASFDPADGALAGTPGPSDVGSYAVTIAVSDGSVQASLSFALDVVQASARRTTLSWLAPQDRTDGSPLQNLAGFRVYYGTQPDALAEVIHVVNPGATSVVVENLTPGTWYFAMTAVDAQGLESARSSVVSKSIS